MAPAMAMPAAAMAACWSGLTARPAAVRSHTRPRQVLGSVQGITHGLNEQSSAARDIAQRVEQIAGASESNASSAARITHAASELEDLARTLESLSGRFRIA